MGNDLADAFVVRAMAWAKTYTQDGDLFQHWDDLADAVRFPGAGSDMAREFRAAGVVAGPVDELMGWTETNGRLVRKMLADRDRKRRGRGGLKRVNPARSGSVGRSVGGSVGRGAAPRTVAGLSADKKVRAHSAPAGVLLVKEKQREPGEDG